MPDIKFNAAIARSVMGWPVIDSATPLRTVLSRGGYIHHDIPQVFVGTGYSSIMFVPDDDARHDMQVLHRIVQSWNHDLVQEFVENLKTIRWNRSDCTQAFSLELFAQPGDYSRAAMMTLNDHPEMKEG